MRASVASGVSAAPSAPSDSVEKERGSPDHDEDDDDEAAAEDDVADAAENPGAASGK